MRVLIIDDEAHCISTLKWNLQEYIDDIEIVGNAKDGEDGYMAIKTLKPDLVFLDIEMPNLNGIDMLERFDKIEFKVIFVTAYNQYAIKAIKLSAVDYLLKPIDKDELIAAVQKVRQIQTDVINESLNVFKHNMKSITDLQKVIVPSNEGVMFFDIATIVNLESQSNYTIIYFENNSKVLSSKTLKEYEEALPIELFFRCHNSHIINLKHIKIYHRGDGGSIVLSNEREVEVSRRKKGEFLERVGPQ